jgi:hypothetical protein
MSDGRELWVLADLFQVDGIHDWLLDQGVTEDNVCAAAQYALETAPNGCGKTERLMDACRKVASYGLARVPEGSLCGVSATAAQQLIVAHRDNAFLGRACDVTEELRFVDKWIRANAQFDHCDCAVSMGTLPTMTDRQDAFLWRTAISRDEEHGFAPNLRRCCECDVLQVAQETMTFRSAVASLVCTIDGNGSVDGSALSACFEASPMLRGFLEDAHRSRGAYLDINMSRERADFEGTSMHQEAHQSSLAREFGGNIPAERDLGGNAIVHGRFGGSWQTGYVHEAGRGATSATSRFVAVGVMGGLGISEGKFRQIIDVAVSGRGDEVLAWSCVCVYVFMCVCVYVCMCVCEYVSMCVCVCICVYAWQLVYMYICVCVCICICLCMCLASI